MRVIIVYQIRGGGVGGGQVASERERGRERGERNRAGGREREAGGKEREGGRERMRERRGGRE